MSASECVRLCIDDAYDQVDPYIFDPDSRIAEFQSRQNFAEDARALGIIVTQEAFDSTRPDDYVVRHPFDGPEQDVAEVHSAVPDLRVPKTQNFEEFDADPIFPVMAKDGWTPKGGNKYLLESSEQWERFRTFVTCSGPFRAVSEADQRAYDDAKDKMDRAASDAERSYWKESVDEWATWIKWVQYPSDIDLRSLYQYQQAIETPGDRFTSYRVVVTAAGDILASSLLYSAATKGNTSILQRQFDLSKYGIPGDDVTWFLEHPESLVYLGAHSNLSNASRGGGTIVLDPNEHSKWMTPEEREIVSAHGLDPEYPCLPEVLRDQSVAIGRASRNRGVLFGLDFIQEAGTNAIYFLERNREPGPTAFADAHLGGIQKVDRADAIRTMKRAALKSLVA